MNAMINEYINEVRDRNMKERYETPELEITKLAETDIITDSNETPIICVLD